MATIWITYAWDDNKAGDVDFFAAELQAAGLNVKHDRWNISAGRRLWEQIERFICSESESNAWLIVATDNSLSSEKCKEEFAYALDRALSKRGSTFPVIALFLGPTNPDLIPAGIKTRLYVSATDPDWKERIVAAAEGRPHLSSRPEIQPYYLHVHTNQAGERPIAIEVRPRAGVWAPFIVGIPMVEKDAVAPFIMRAPRYRPSLAGVLTSVGEGTSGDLWIMSAGGECTPTQSYYIWCKNLPSRLVFGVADRQPQYTVTFKN
ncbi:MAG TPA: toll/interleukin-1 receptor domain-containing protein [Steroidobacteraceae bacterium]|jgi:hypothetical protein|nr:toll/interleukin-1 receptor domain-containing protein [Steroidobacteraceae bacterium]